MIRVLKRQIHSGGQVDDVRSGMSHLEMFLNCMYGNKEERNYSIDRITIRSTECMTFLSLTRLGERTMYLISGIESELFLWSLQLMTEQGHVHQSR